MLLTHPYWKNHSYDFIRTLFAVSLFDQSVYKGIFGCMRKKYAKYLVG